MFWGPLARLGLATAAATAVLDQALKLWLLFVFDLQNARRRAPDAVPRPCPDLEQGHQLRACSSSTARSANGRCWG